MVEFVIARFYCTSGSVSLQWHNLRILTQASCSYTMRILNLNKERKKEVGNLELPQVDSHCLPIHPASGSHSGKRSLVFRYCKYSKQNS